MNPIHQHPSRPPAARRGNALILALTMSVIVGGLIFSITDSGATAQQQVAEQTRDPELMGALETVLRRREGMVIEAASQGGPGLVRRFDPRFNDAAIFAGENNYGVDHIGGVQVRWRIEPMQTHRLNGLNQSIEWMQNPAPDPSAAVPLQANERDNQVVFAFRIAGEARLTIGNRTLRAQGARFAAVNMEPLFRYVIFYAKEGPGGDLEMTHADPVQIAGSIHSNGSIYFGAGLRVNDKVARLGALDSALSPSTTTIGPDSLGRPVAVTCSDGVFRLNKALMYAIANQYPLSSDVSAGAGSGPVGVSFAQDDLLDLLASPRVNIHYPEGSNASIGTLTLGGTLVSPWRVKPLSGAVTVAAQGSGGSLTYASTDTRVTINGTPLRGIDQGSGTLVANDSRSPNWISIAAQTSAPGFSGRVKDQVTGGRVIRLPPLMQNRALEPQQLENTEQPAEHQRPKFIVNGATVYDMPTAAGTPVVEAAGQYLRYALGQSDIHFARWATGDGWFLANAAGTPTDGRQLASRAGLIIRERMVPDTALWPGVGSAGTLVPSTHPRYMPYAYGKQWYPTGFPFSAIDLSDAVHQRYRGSTSYPGSAWLNHGTDTASRRQTWDGQVGSLYLTAANAPGPRRNDETGTTSTTGFANWGANWRFSTAAPANDAARAALYAAAGGSPSPRKPYFYAENWRFVHLQQPAAGTSAGWWRTQFNDLNAPTPTSAYVHSTSANETWHSLLGQSSASSAQTVASPSAAHGALTPISAANYTSMRWEAMLVPGVSSIYTFSMAGSGQYRVFVDGDLVLDNWFSANAPLNAPLLGFGQKSLTAGATVPVVVESYRYTSAPTLTLSWKASSWASSAVIPTAPVANAGEGGSMYQRSSSLGFRRDAFTAAQVLVRNVTADTTAPAAKYGLMLRDAGGGLSPLMSGSDRYLMIGWSPARGIFAQQRLERAYSSEHTLGNQFYIGAGSGPSGAADATGVITDNSLSVSTVSRTATLKEDLAARGAVQVTAIAYPTNTVNGSTTWTGNTTPVSVPTLDLGGGKTWTFTGSVAKGTWTAARTSRIDKRRSETAYQILKYDLIGAVRGFDDTDRSNQRTLRIFTAGTGTGVYNTANVDSDAINSSTSYTTAASVPPSADRWYVYGTGGAATPWTQLRRRFEYTRVSPSWTTGTTVNQSNSNTIGGATTLWYTGAAPTINKVGVISTATLADINAMTGGSYTALLPLPTVSAPSVTWTPAPTAPADGSTAAITDTGVPTLPDFTAGRSFQVQRSGSSVQFDLNSFITRMGTWFAPAVDQYAPWVAAWGAIDSGVAETGGFRPDFYRGPAAPASAILTSENNTGGTTWQNGTQPWKMGDDIATPGATQAWLRITRSAATGRFNLHYYTGPLATPAAGDFTAVTGSSGTPLDISLPAGWSDRLLIGPCLQSGDAQTPASAEFASMRIETTEAADGVIDATDWNNAVPGDAMPRYLASQYQVFLGGVEITEDFFSWRAAGQPVGNASEDWFYNPREFWSQSRWWEHRTSAAPATAIDKDAGTFTDLTNRTLLAKTTVLTLNLDQVQDYLRTRTLSQATLRPLSNPLASAVLDLPDTLRSRFNGLLYAHRSNRYPWNPATDPDLGTPAALNPFSAANALALPNSGVNQVERVANGTALGGWAPAAVLHQGVHKLQPYALAQAPAFKPQQFHHGVRIARANSIDWNYADRGTLTAGVMVHAANPRYGDTKLSIVTPNQLHIQGDLNSVPHQVLVNGAPTAKCAPLAIMGDVVTLLSNNWDKDASGATVGDLKYQLDGLSVANSAGSGCVSGVGTLAVATLGAPATSTTYNAAIVTHNIPTGKSRVAEGQAAPFVDTMLFLENWNGATMTYEGSLVVLDTRRYSDAFLHDAAKKYGRTPFGIAAPAEWAPVHGAADWLGQSPVIYSEPVRVYAFNEDFLTADGTPPFTPFGMTIDGLGSWTNIAR